MKTNAQKESEEDFLFRTMDSISNAVSDSCEPQIVPSIEPYICADAEEYGLPKLEFIEMPETFRVNLYRKPLPMAAKPNDGEPLAEHRQNVGESSAEYRLDIGGTSVEHRRNIGDAQLNATQRKIVECLLEDSTLTGAALAERIGISKRNIEANIKKLKDMGILVRHGFPKGGYWEVGEK